MTPEINEFLKRITTAKGITMLIVVLFLAIFIWKNLDFFTEVSFTLKNDKTNASKTTAGKTAEKDKEIVGTPALALGDLLIPPTPAKLPSIMVFEVKNPGSDVTKDIRINIDLGTAKVIEYEIIGPKSDEAQGSEAGISILNIDIKQIRPHESLYIYIHSSVPTFKRISLSSKSTSGVEEFTLNDYLKNKGATSKSDFANFLLIIASIFIVVMSIYFTMVLISKLNKWLKTGW
jgi:hypothetical protein